MALLTGPVAVSRFTATQRPENPDFEGQAFREISPGSEIRESIGFVPMKPGADYEIGAKRFAFRVRIDRRKADPAQVRERLEQLIQVELDQTGAPYVGPKKRRMLKQLAEEELIVGAQAKTKFVECCLDGDVLYVGSSSRSELGLATNFLRRIDIEAEPLVPWAEMPATYSELVEASAPGESPYGCQFLKALVGDADFLIEPEVGRVVLAMQDRKVTLAGAVLSDLHRFLDRDAEMLSAKFLLGEIAFALDGPSFRVSGLRLPTPRTEHWTEDLDERIGQIAYLFERLDERFREVVR